jgi:hypothetical protein
MISLFFRSNVRAASYRSLASAAASHRDKAAEGFDMPVLQEAELLLAQLT